MLEICDNFFTHLNSLGIRYCHWKSNEHLNEALEGKTDLDVLVHPQDDIKFKEVLRTFQFKKILSPPEKQFPGLEDFLGFDYETGRLVHLHLHYRLVLGQKYIKNHHLPIENLVLENLIEKNTLFIPCPELELILLIIRAHMKVELVSLAKHAIKDFTSSAYTAFPPAIESELSVLIAQSNIDKLKKLLQESGLPLQEDIFVRFIDRYSKSCLKFYNISLNQLAILNGLKDYRRTKSPLVYLQYFRFFVEGLPLIKRFKTSKRKTLEGQGKIIAIVGADGSGKSTLIEDLHKWLSWKLSVKQYYLGIPKSYMVNGLVYYLRRVFQALRLSAADTLIEAYYWLYVARTRKSISLASRREANQGKVIITDRFPLREFSDMERPMDGPRLIKHDRLANSSFAKHEACIYENIQYPDRIFVLQVEISELRKRKSDLSFENHNRKAEVINSIESGAPFEIIDANKPYDEVILEIKRRMWKIL